MRRIVMLAAALGALAGRAHAGERPKNVADILPPGAYLSDPTWVRTPTSAEVAALFPEQARRARKGEAVAADCVISASGALDQCEIDFDSAPERGFDSATLQALQLYQTSATTHGGRPVGGLRILLRLSWKVPASLAAQPELEAQVMAAARRPAAQSSGTIPEPGPFVIWQPDWVRLPTGEDLASLYPLAARQEGISGEAVLECAATRDGGLSDCVVLRESPSGQGFGQATLGAARFMGIRRTLADGGSVEGAIVLFPMKWKLGQ